MRAIAILLLFSVFSGYCQVTNQGKPESWHLLAKAKINAIAMPGLDLAKLEAEDRINDADKKKAWRYGYEFLVDHNLQNSGNWTTLPNGDRIWRIRYSSAGAKTMNFLFSDYYMPAGARIYLYNDDKTDLLGAYDAAQNNEKRELGTWLVSGDDIWIEYYEPAAVAGQGKLEIFKVVHGYRSVSSILKSPDSNLNDSGKCNYDVDCDIDGINSLKSINKKAVGLIIVNNSSFCTGALINTTANDGTPYLLTANHCTEGRNIANWAFRFNWISPDPVCAENRNSTSNAPEYYQTASGAELMAKNLQSDFCLVKLTSALPAEWDLVWAGWSRSETPPTATFGIHHPSGDIMKVCKDNNPPSMQNDEGQSVWVVNDWDMGVTEGGSSGSPLFDNNGRIIGQLYGGESECTGTTDNVGFDIYGRFGVSWDSGSSSASRLKEWLDPENTNAITMNYRAGNGDPVEEVQEFKIYPNPSDGTFTIIVPGTSQYSIYTIIGQLVTQGQFVEGNNGLNLSALAGGIYVLAITDASGKTTDYKLVKK